MRLNNYIKNSDYPYEMLIKDDIIITHTFKKGDIVDWIDFKAVSFVDTKNYKYDKYMLSTSIIQTDLDSGANYAGDTCIIQIDSNTNITVSTRTSFQRYHTTYESVESWSTVVAVSLVVSGSTSTSLIWTADRDITISAKVQLTSTPIEGDFPAIELGS